MNLWNGFLRKEQAFIIQAWRLALYLSRILRSTWLTLVQATHRTVEWPISFALDLASRITRILARPFGNTSSSESQTTTSSRRFQIRRSSLLEQVDLVYHAAKFYCIVKNANVFEVILLSCDLRYVLQTEDISWSDSGLVPDVNIHTVNFFFVVVGICNCLWFYLHLFTLSAFSCLWKWKKIPRKNCCHCEAEIMKE